MIPNFYKIAGELIPMVIHVAARSLAAQGLSIFGDHSDVMAARATGLALLASASVQEAQDMALIAQMATLESRVPFVHFFDGFRTSHEINTLELLSDEEIRLLMDDELIRQHRARALNPDAPSLRGTAQNPDVYFQARETVNPYYTACSTIVQNAMDRFAEVVGRQYSLYEYDGAADAERVIVVMGSGAETVQETVSALNAVGERVGVVKVRLFRPLDSARLARAIPLSARAVAVLDRTKEPGAGGEPLYLDVVNALFECYSAGRRQALPKVIGGRYGLSSKEFTPAMVKGIFDHLRQPKLKNHFTIGIDDDVSFTSLPYDPAYSIERKDVVRAIFYGLGSDGTVGANKNSIKIIGENTNNYAQGYFVYDSKKSGSATVSHLRFGPNPIRAPYLISQAQFIACHQPSLLERFNVLESAMEGGIFLLNTPHPPEKVWDTLPRKMQIQILEKNLRFYVINAYQVARESGMGGRINTAMQVCFFALSGVLPPDQAIAQIKASIRKTYAKKGEAVVAKNLQVVDMTLAHLHEVLVPQSITSTYEVGNPVPESAPAFVHDVLGAMLMGKGDALPVSALPLDGIYPTGTARYEKRNLAQEIPVWSPDLCIQCGKCAFVCPHAVIRIKTIEPQLLTDAPPTFKTAPARDKEFAGQQYSIQVSPEDCTACGLCVDVCPAKDKANPDLKALVMQAQAPLRESESANWGYFLSLPDVDRRRIKVSSLRQQQLQEPLFEFSGACAGCGETPYLKLASQLFGDRMVVANATGCSSIYGGNLPTTPWTFNAEGRGVAWANSLFEDNAEFGLGIRTALDQQAYHAQNLLRSLASEVGETLAEAILNAPQKDEADIYAQRERVAVLKERLRGLHSESAQDLLSLADALVKRSVWIVGGDGWAYDIGYGGLDHVLASGRNVNILVMDTEVYSNTGGQMSKATPHGAVAKFASGGKPTRKKDLGLMAMTYGNVYVASVAMGAKDEHTLRAFLEAEAYEGVSLIIAYSHCIAHGIPMNEGLRHQKAAVESGQWLLYRYHPDRAKAGENPLLLDSPAPKISVADYMATEGRFHMLSPENTQAYYAEAQTDADQRLALYRYLSRPIVHNGEK
jgi:pyruvate-ferredoxin/flavodoxin oxidoreductase